MKCPFCKVGYKGWAEAEMVGREIVYSLMSGHCKNYFFCEKENSGVDMFVTGFDLTKMELLKPLKDFIMNFDSGLLDFRSGLRLETMKEYFKEQAS